MALSAENAKMFDIYERLFAEPGWKELVEDLSERRARLGPTLLSDLRATEKELAFAQGQNNIYNYIINLEDILAKAKAQAQEDTTLPEL